MVSEFITINVENVEVSAAHVTGLLSAHPLSPYGIYTESVVSPLEELLQTQKAHNEKNPRTLVGAELENGQLWRA